MADPFSATVGKVAISAAARPTIAILRSQIARRGAEYADLERLKGGERELGEALAVLQGSADSLPAYVLTKLKGFLSARPSTFDDADAQLFIGDDRVAALVKSGVHKTFANRDIEEERAKARELHVELFGGDGVYGEGLAEDAIRFGVLTLLAHLTPGERQVMQLLADQHDEVIAHFLGLEEKLADIRVNLGVGSLRVDSDILDEALAGEVRLLRRQRLAPATGIKRAEDLGARVDGGLSLASDKAKAEACREISATLARSGCPEKAEAWLERAASFGADNLICEEARIAIAREEPETALRLLRGRRDSLSLSLMIDAIRQRDGDAAAIEYFEREHEAGDLTGFGLLAMAGRFLNADRQEDSERLLSQASAEQIEQCPLLLYARARARIAGALPSDTAERYLQRDGVIPQPRDVRDDAEGASRLEAALADLRQLEPMLLELDAPDLATLVDLNIVFLELNTGDDEQRSRVREALVERLSDPEQAVELAPLVRMYRIRVDWTALRAELDRAEKLGGWTDSQLRAAFALVMDSDVPADVAAFVHRYRDRLQPYIGSGDIVAIEIEARARAGDIAGARELIEAERQSLGEDQYAFLVATIAEIEGADAVELRLERFKETDSTHDLEILVDTLGKKRDDRVGEYLILLWRRRHQADDARRACDVLLMSGQEARLEAFLEELGDQARQDPDLRTHLAWARQRQGRLTDAAIELRGLRDAGVDDVNTRQLTIMLAVETGRWSELEPFVQEQLTKKQERTASELLAAAKIALAIDSPTTMELARAAVAAAPDDPAINVGAYHIAINMGRDRDSDVNQWLARAVATSGEDGPLQRKEFDEAVELMRESREEADRIMSLINAGELPLFIAMKRSTGTQSALIIEGMRGNAEETDGRRRTVLPLYAGNREFQVDLDPRCVALDPVSLLVLDQLALLERALDGFEEVMVPAGTLHSFFEDRGNAGPSQPSRVEQAQGVKDRIAAGVLSVEDLPQGAAGVRDSAGVEFDRLYSAAQARDGNVVDSSPLHKPGQLRETTEATPFIEHLKSPAGVVASLFEQGIISEARAARAGLHVSQSGKAWDNEPVLQRGRPLFLSTLAVHYLSDADLLPILKAYAGTLIVLPEVETYADQEIAAGRTGARARQGIERIRYVLAQRIANGRLRIGPTRIRRDEVDENGIPIRDMGPVMSALRDGGGMDAFVCDDRGMNRYTNFTDQTGKSVPLLTTPDLLGIMHRKGLLVDLELADAREQLRLSGAGLVPISPQEIATSALRSDWARGPNAELRAIRDSIHLPLARGIVNLPNERKWFELTVLATAFAARRAWQEIDDPALAERAATYLWEMIPDAAAWSAKDEAPDRAFWVQATSRKALWAVASIFDLTGQRRDAYRRWFDGSIAPAAERKDPGVIEALARTFLEFITRPLPADDELDDH